MKLHRRSKYVLVILLALLLGLIVFREFLYLEPWGSTQPTSLQLTATYIISQNHIVETLIHQTETASAEGIGYGMIEFYTITPEGTTSHTLPTLMTTN